MTELLQSPAVVIALVTFVGHAVITWWRVGVNEKALSDNRKDVALELAALGKEIDSLREWRARARTQIEALMAATNHPIPGNGEDG